MIVIWDSERDRAIDHRGPRLAPTLLAPLSLGGTIRGASQYMRRAAFDHTNLLSGDSYAKLLFINWTLDMR